MKNPFLKNEKDFHLEIHADENNLGEIRDYVSNVCAQAGFNKRETNNTKLAVDEACTNIIKHAYSGKSGKITVDMRVWSGNVEIHLRDKGNPFNWSGVKDPDLEEYVEMGKRGGLGIYLMNRLMDDIKYESSSDGNHLIMAKSSKLSLSGKRPLVHSIKTKWTQTLRFKFLLRASTGLFGIIAIIGLIQFINQTRDIENARQKAWLQMRSFAQTLEFRSENALVLDDLYHPEYRKLNEFIHDGMKIHPEIKYIRVVNMKGMVVSSSIADEFGQLYEAPSRVRDLSSDGKWIALNRDDENIKEFHLPIVLSGKNPGERIIMGQLAMGVSSAEIEMLVQDERFKTIVILFGMFMSGIGLVYLLISIFIKPIQTLTDGVIAIGEGSLEDELDIKGPKEIGAIAKAFNEITAKFRVAQESVVEQERMQKEMQVAQEIQHSLLPRNVPEIGGYDIASYYKAAKEVGGDYYDFVNVDDDTLGVVVADVSGKGVPGSLVMTMIRTALRMEARGNHSAADVMAKMNEFVTQDMKKGMFVTIFYVILDSRNRVISYASAGHNPMILYRAETNETFYLNPRGFPVGINLPDDKLFEKSIDVEKIKLKKNDMLLIYTDGVTEAMNEKREQFGEKRLLKLMKKSGSKSPQEFIDILSNEIDKFTGQYPQNDDITVVAFKEKYMADEVLLGIRRRLLDLVSVEGISVTDACSKMKVSPSTYYRYKKRLELMGDRGLKNKNLREEHAIRRLSNEQRTKLLEVIKENPRFGAKRIADRLNLGRGKANLNTSSLVYNELKRMRLNTYEKRLDYLRRNGIKLEQEIEDSTKGTIDIKKVKREIVIGEEEVVEQKKGSILTPQRDTVGEMSVGSGGSLERVSESVIEERGDEKFSKEWEYEKDAEEFRYGSDSPVRIEDEKYNEDITVLKVSGHLDSSSTGELESVMEDLYEEGTKNIIVDLNDVLYISSGGWGVFVGRVKNLREKEGDVVLVGMSPEVYDIFELLGFMDILMQFRLKEEAIRFLSLPFHERQKHLKVKRKSRKKKKSEKKLIPEILSIDESDMTPLRIKAGLVGDNGEITILELQGIIDTVSSLELREAFDRILGKGTSKIIADMSGVEYVSSAGWGVFASRIDGMRKKGGDLKIFGMDPDVNRIFKLLEFDDLMHSFNILAEAVEDFNVEIAESSHDKNNLGSKPAVVVTGRKRNEVENYTFGVDLERIKISGNVGVVLKVSGAIDASTNDEFEINMERSLSDNPAFLLVDLSDVVYINSSGWGNIVKYVQQLNSSGTKLALIGMNSAIYKIFIDLGFEPLINHFLDREKAIDDMINSSWIKSTSSDVKEGINREEKLSKKVKRNKGRQGKKVEEKIEKYDGKAEREILYSSRIPEEDYINQVSAKEEDSSDSGELAEDHQGVSSYSGLDIERDKVDKREEKDRKIKNLGWGAYGEKLSNINRKGNKGTKK
ncbi:anti-sigma factor antagonist [bacterium]|nr:anti-sigma factor antagonist [bacterium]